MPARPHFAHSNLGLGSKNRKSSSEKHSAPVPQRTDGSKCYAHLEVPNTFNHCITLNYVISRSVIMITSSAARIMVVGSNEYSIMRVNLLHAVGAQW